MKSSQISKKQKYLLSYDHAEDPEAIARRLKYQFRHDLHALRLQYKIECDNRTKRYYLVEAPFRLSLSKEQLIALAIISQTFDEKTFPYASDIRDLLTSLLDQLPHCIQRKMVVDQSFALNIEFSEKTDYSSLDAKTLYQYKECHFGIVVSWSLPTARHKKAKSVAM